MLPCQPVCPDRNPPGLGHLGPFVDLSEVNGDAGHHGVLLQSFCRHLLVMLSPHVDHRRSATPQRGKTDPSGTGCRSLPNGSLSLTDLLFLKAFARASRHG